ncbi:MAG: aspartate--tRNA(Asn) ligase [Candidatus Staskawiczbacteria bacterium]|nr:aspartate--tRNA(Asn) ligase [Candidatus Staskawiczbacteria bacterium]
MPRFLIKDAARHVGEKVKVAGWVNVRRAHGKILFIDLRDISGVMQLVFIPSNQEAYKLAEEIRPEWVIEVEGQVVKRPDNMVNPKIETGQVEMPVESLKVLSEAETPPIPVEEEGADETDIDKRMDWRWLDLRKAKNLLIFKTWTLMEAAFREFWISNNYIEIHSPKLIATASESGSEVFEVKYFKTKAYLAQSPQFYKQMAMASGFEKVFEVGPVFRAEPSFTSRHATEFTGYDAEISFIESHNDIMDEEERMISYGLKRIKDEYGDQIKELFNREVVVPSVPFPRISMKEAKEILSSRGIKSEKDGDIAPEEERGICDYVKEKYNHEFVFITGYPVSVRPFYHMHDEEDPNLTKSFDLLWNGLEITTGAQREHRYDVLISQAKQKKMNVKKLQFYLDFFKYGCPPHGGYGMGPNRMIMKLFGIENLRDAMFVYRGVKRLTP